MNEPTLGSIAELPAAPMPRIAMRMFAVCGPRFALKLGTSLGSVATLSTCAFCSVVPVNAAIETGTSCTLSSRFCAVTTISSIAIAPVSAASCALAARAAARTIAVAAATPRTCVFRMIIVRSPPKTDF